MKLLISKEQLLKLRSRDLVPCECYTCNKVFYTPKNAVLRALKGTVPVKYCSRECGYKAKIKPNPNKVCEFCEKEFVPSKGYRLKQRFCSLTCGSRYNNSKIKQIRYCKNCQQDISGKGQKYCSHKCQWEYRTKITLQKWFNNEYKGYCGNLHQISPTIKNYLIKKAGHKCPKCGWNKIHPITKRIPLQINHIDGDSTNSRPENLEILCPNCHSLTPNFGSLNKNSKRIRK